MSSFLTRLRMFPASQLAGVRSYCMDKNKIEKCLNQVTLLGRCGIEPQLRGTETRPVVIFTMATNTNYRFDTGDIQQKTEWHRVSVFKPYLRDLALSYLKKGTRVYVQGRIMYGELTDQRGVTHTTTTIVAEDIIFMGPTVQQAEEPESHVEEILRE